MSIPVDMDDVIITFTKGIDSSSVNNSTFITTDSDGVTVSGKYSVSNDTIAFNPSSNLSYNTVYTITAKSAILDIDGNPMAEEFSWTFTTEDAPAGAIPLIEYFRINSGKPATNVDTVTLDIAAKNADGVSGSMEFRYRAVGDVAWSSWLPLTDGFGTVSSLSLGITAGNFEMFEFEAEVRNEPGSKSVVIVDSIYYEEESPVIQSTTPTGSSVPGNTTFASVTFNEEMDPLSINTTRIYVEDISGTPLNGSLLFKSNNSIPNSTVEITGLSLDQFKTYFLVVSSLVQDVAGNTHGKEDRYEFATGSASDTTPPEVALSIDSLANIVDGAPNNPGANDRSITLSNGLEASNRQYLNIAISAQDDFNGIKDMKVWDASSSEPPNYTAFSSFLYIDIDPLSSGAGIKYIYYKVRDWALNETSGYIQIVLDTAAPTLNFSIDSGATYTTDVNGSVSFGITVDDTLPGGEKLTGVTHMTYSETLTDLDAGSEAWVPFSDSVGGFNLSANNGTKTIYMKVKDYLGQTSSVISKSIIWDTEAPAITINEADYLEVNAQQQQITTISDNTDASPTILWTKESGPGTVTFSDPSIESPLVSADTDGTYSLKVTVTDGAGYSSAQIIPFIWDTTAPADVSSVSTPTFNNTGQPQWTWSVSADADYYRLSYNSGMASPWTINDINTTSWAPSTALADGDYTVYVQAVDNAGNSSVVPGSAATEVDTIAPAISNDGQLFLTNQASQITINYTDGTDGTVIEAGSGLSTVLWENIGAGTLSFGNSSSRTTTVSTSVASGSRAIFNIRLTAVDNAGNSNSASFTIDWDKEPPAAPSIDGIGWDPVNSIYHTPDLTPTWFWQSGGNGSGVYDYKLDSGAWFTDTTPSGTTVTDFTAGTITDASSNEVASTHYLYVKEKDQVGNWSAEASLGIWIDNLYTSAPSVTANVPPVTTNTSITWSWSSGAAASDGTNRYRYTLDNWSTYKNVSGSIGDTGESFIFDASGQTIGTTVSYVFRIEEYHDNIWQGVDKIGMNSVTVDLQGPTAPSVSVIADTNDTTPTWTWSTNGSSDGTGVFRYQMDSTAGAWSSNTTQTAYTPSTALTEGSHTLYVEEQDPLGNWSVPQGATVAIDITPPVLNSVIINSGNKYTNTNNGLSVAIDAVTAGETGMTMSILDYDPAAAWEPFEPYSSVKITNVPTGEGYKNVYVRLKDSVGNISAYKYDSIILDTTAPTSTTLALNGGDFYTPSFDGYFDASATDNYALTSEIEVQHAYYNGSSWYTSTWEPIGTGLNFDSIYTNGTGYKYVYARFRDLAGNYTTTATNPSGGGWISDYIYMQVTGTGYAQKGYASNGAVNVYYSEVNDPDTTDSYVNGYYIYSTTDPGLIPTTSSSGLTYEGYADQTASAYKTVYVPTGEIRYFWVRAYNSDSGGYGYFTPAGVPGFSSNVTVIYDDQDSKDILIAEYIKALLEDTYYAGGILAEANMGGTMPSYSVTLFPERLVDNSTYSSIYRIYGDPIIVTPGTSFTRASTTYDIRVRNIASGGKGLIAMGFYGLTIIDRINTNWTAWSLSGTAPSQIGTYQSGGLGSNKSAKTRAASISESIWHSPMQNTYLTSNYSESSINLSNIFNTTTGDVYRYGAYLGTTPSVTDGYVYAGDYNYSSYYPVVRQGRFLQYGYVDIPGRGYTGAMTYQYGQTFFINLIARMDNF